MIDSGWEAHDGKDLDPRVAQELSDACVEYLQRKPEARLKWRAFANLLAIAVRGEDGTIMAWQTEVKAERIIYADEV